VARQKPTETPLMRQFLEIKDRFPDAIVFFRLGDFYEMFFEDAVIAARLLDLTLTTRDKGKADAVPMCGVPHHAARTYVSRLTDAGHKVVICDQVEDARLAKGLVRREVVRVVTPGVILDDEVLTPKCAHYLASVASVDGSFGLTYLDVSTGEFRGTQVAGPVELADELARVAPREVLYARGDGAARTLAAVRRRYPVTWTEVAGEGDPAALARLEKQGIATERLTLPLRRAAANALAYAQTTQPGGRLPISALELHQPGDAVVLDETAVANLELVETIVGRQRKGSLLELLDHTATAVGGRCLRRWLLYPLTEVAAIQARQEAVAWLVEHGAARAGLFTELEQIYDVERLTCRAMLGVAGPRDLGRLRDSLLRLPAVAQRLAGAGSEVLAPGLFVSDALEALGQRLNAALVDAPPIQCKDGPSVRPGVDAVVDECRRLTDGGKAEILAIETRERERSGIASLKVRYNRVFGYYIEVTRSHMAKVPADYVRKQTVATGERFVTEELAELERKVLQAEQTLGQREAQLVADLVEAVVAEARALTAVARRLAVLDACASLAEVAQRRGYVRPIVDDSCAVDIRDGRHPVIEALVGDGKFVPNDCHLDTGDRQIALITGPNMAGKSTYMRQVAHIVLLAQMGSFVPASSARIGLVDRIFTRVGAADNLSRGDSTFMVEMREAAAILAGATPRSLVVLDEIGRGTSTFDGLSIAWAITEHLHDVVGARTLFATHYHELTRLAAHKPRVHNASMLVSEQAGEIVFLRRVVAGGASKSYGIDVARLAGLPPAVIARAREILAELERDSGGERPTVSPLSVLEVEAAPSLASQLQESLAALDPNQLTPIAALRILDELCRAARPDSGPWIQPDLGRDN
jgi:DNA mismatch repair protein MutS